MNILERIQGHEDLVRLSQVEQAQLCDELRQFLVSNVAQTGGHLASNLGVVELSVALETVFDTKVDRLVFDVGHQSYIHKILTDRRDQFSSLRRFGGIAGFPKPSESITDAFVAGHASNSVSVALGMARARTLQKEHYSVLALIGDGATTGGLAYEGLNDAGASHEPLIVILNDNEMSIAHNVGGVAHHLSKLRTRPGYFGIKRVYRSVTNRIPGGKFLYQLTHRMKTWMKNRLLDTTLFEDMGFTYIGPVDGHDLKRMIYLLRVARGLQCPVVFHVITKKGKGYGPAEEHPSQFHGVGPFDQATGALRSASALTFSDTFGDTMLQLGRQEPRLCAITAAMPAGTGLTAFEAAYPNRTFDVGIAEGHAVSMAGGLAKAGMIPVVAIYSTFLQRAYDMILQDVAMLHLHVIFAVDRAGLVGEDGETHHGIFDLSYLKHMPNLTIMAPQDGAELEAMMELAAKLDGPCAIRYPRGTAPQLGGADHAEKLEVGRAMRLREGKDADIWALGSMVEKALDAAELLKEQGFEAGVVNQRFLKPLDEEALQEAAKAHDLIVTLEDNVLTGGAGEEIDALLINENTRVLNMGWPDTFIEHGSCDQLYRVHGLDAAAIAERIKKELEG